MDGADVPLFSCEDLSLDLGGREVLRKIELEVRPGEVLGIIGPNGAGKTSLLEILSGSYAPKTGKVFYEGKDINAPAPVRASADRHRAHLSDAGRARRTDGRRDHEGGTTGLPALADAFRRRIRRELGQLRRRRERPTSVLKTFERRKLLLAAC